MNLNVSRYWTEMDGKRQARKRLYALETGNNWSGRMDLNHRPPGPELENQKFISAAPGVAYGIAGHLFPLLNWTEVGRKS